MKSEAHNAVGTSAANSEDGRWSAALKEYAR